MRPEELQRPAKTPRRRGAPAPDPDRIQPLEELEDDQVGGDPLPSPPLSRARALLRVLVLPHGSGCGQHEYPKHMQEQFRNLLPAPPNGIS